MEHADCWPNVSLLYSSCSRASSVKQGARGLQATFLRFPCSWHQLGDASAPSTSGKHWWETARQKEGRSNVLSASGGSLSNFSCQGGVSRGRRGVGWLESLIRQSDTKNSSPAAVNGSGSGSGNIGSRSLLAPWHQWKWRLWSCCKAVAVLDPEVSVSVSQ